MTDNEFTKMIEEVFKTCSMIMTTKKENYATNINRFHNFDERSKINNLPPVQIAFSDFTKHFQAFKDKLYGITINNKYEILPIALYDENIIDMINYLVLIRGLLIRNIKGEREQIL